MSCYDDNPLTSEQQYAEACRLGIGHLRSDKPAGVLTLCPNCKGYVPKRVRTCPLCGLKFEQPSFYGHLCEDHENDPKALAYHLAKMARILLNRKPRRTKAAD